MTSKHINHYITVTDGIDFRQIAKIMTKKNFPMNHATARNVLISALIKLAKHVSEKLNIPLTEDAIEQLLKNQLFHEALTDLLYAAHNEENKEKEVC